MRFGDMAMEEVYQRWTALCDATWQRKYGKLLLALTLIWNAGAAVGLLLLCQQAYVMFQQLPVPGAPQPQLFMYLARVVYPLAALALPVTLVLGSLRARLAELPYEFVAVLSRTEVFELKLRAIHRALYLTVLPAALLPECMQAARQAVTQWLNLTTFSGMVPNLAHEPVFVSASSAWWLLTRLGWIVCLLEWQAIMLSRFPPRASQAWRQLIPYGVMWVGVAAGYVADLDFTPQRGLHVGWHVPSGILSYGCGSELFALMLGLVCAPLLWRWAAQARSSSRWVVVALCCLMALHIWDRYYLTSGSKTVRQTSTHAVALGRGLYLGSMPSPLSDSGIQQHNILKYDLLAVCLAPDDAEPRGLASPGTSESLTVLDASDELAHLKTPGPGIPLTFNIFIPWYLALVALMLYYVYSYYILRRAARIMPAGDDELAQRR